MISATEIPDGMRKCPFCAEIIRSEAKICRFCQRDLPLDDATEDKPATSSEGVAPRPLRYGDRVASPILGDGTVVGTEPDRGSVLVVFDRDHVQRRIATDELGLISKQQTTSRTVPADRSDDILITVAWLTAFFIPLIGFICGVVLLSRNKVGHGVGSMVVSLIMSGIWLAVIQFRMKPPGPPLPYILCASQIPKSRSASHNCIFWKAVLGIREVVIRARKCCGRCLKPMVELAQLADPIPHPRMRVHRAWSRAIPAALAWFKIGLDRDLRGGAASGAPQGCEPRPFSVS
jgi:hypothetical protein